MSTKNYNDATLSVAENKLAGAFEDIKDKATDIVESTTDDIRKTKNNVKKSLKKYWREVDAESNESRESIVNFISEYPVTSVGLALFSGILLSKFFSK
jgi:ElaB/YqjD/DUF883 family membrane-anchored ribosome-binding protein